MSDKQRALEALARAQWRLFPDREAASGFADLQRRVHLGPGPDEA